jgi:alpha-L-fucosidase
MGEWLRTNGEAIYDTTASPFARLPFFGRATRKGNTIYLHVFAWPATGELRVPGVKNRVVKARLLGAPAARPSVRRDGPDLLVKLPAEAPDDAASVIALDLDGPPRLEPFVIRPDRRGVITLGVESSEIETRFEQRAKTETALGHVFLTSWSRADDVPSWNVSVPAAGRYRVEVTYGAGKGAAGKGLTVSAGAAQVAGKIEDTKGEWIWKTFPFGTIDLGSGPQTIRAKPSDKAGLDHVTLEKIVLTPVR